MKILVVDDHVILRKGLIRVLRDDYKQASFIEASCGREAISVLVKNKDIDIVLSDLTMPNINGIEMLKQLKSLYITVPVIILTMHNEDQYALRALKAGAYAFLNKNVPPEELKMAINRVLTGKKYISIDIADILANNISEKTEKNTISQLSDREMEVFYLISKGKTVSEIAKEILLSVNTISTYRARILDKLNLKNNAEIVVYAVENNL